MDAQHLVSAYQQYSPGSYTLVAFRTPDATPGYVGNYMRMNPPFRLKTCWGLGGLDGLGHHLDRGPGGNTPARELGLGLTATVPPAKAAPQIPITLPRLLLESILQLKKINETVGLINVILDGPGDGIGFVTDSDNPELARLLRNDFHRVSHDTPFKIRSYSV